MRTYKSRMLLIVLSSVPVGIIGGWILATYHRDIREAWIIGVVHGFLAMVAIWFWASKGE